MQLAMYRVWVKPDLAFYPVRKAGSTSLQDAFGGQPVDMRQVPVGILKFTMVRNPFDRLASLFANHLDYYPLTDHGIVPGMSWQRFLDKVCATSPPQCDHHLWPANHNVPHDAEVFYFEDYANEVVRLNYTFGLDLKVKYYGRTKATKPTYNRPQAEQIAAHYEKDLIRFYENNRDPQSCRTRGQTEARLRQEALRGTGNLDCFRHRSAPTDSPSE